MNDFHMVEVSEVLAGASGEVSVDLEPDDPTGRSDDLGHYRGVVPNAAAHMDSAIPSAEVEGVEAECEIARLSVVQAPGGIDGDEDVVIEVRGIGIRAPGPASWLSGSRICHGPGPRKCSRGTLANAAASRSDRTFAAARIRLRVGTADVVQLRHELERPYRTSPMSFRA